jgi:hypothetical protein
MKAKSFDDATSLRATGSVDEVEQEAKMDDEYSREDGAVLPATALGEMGGQTDMEPDAQMSRADRPLFQLPFPYGQRWRLSTYPGHDNYDIDMIRASGSTNNQPILAAYDGKVVEAGWNNGGGNYVRIDHGHGWATLYLHMIRSPIVRVGQRVSQGQHIGNVGSTGDSSGPHLHYEQLYHDTKTEAWFNGTPCGITDDATSKPRILKSYNRGGKPEPARPSLVHIRSMNADGTYGDLVPGGSYEWSAGWTQAKPYFVGGVPYLFLLKEGDGTVHIHRLNADGSVGARVKDYDWSPGWSTVEFLSIEGKTYLLLLKKKGYGADGNNVHIHVMNADGTVGAIVRGGSYKWSEGWTQARPYTVGGTPYLFLLKEGDGSVHIHRLNGDGTVGTRIKDYDWSSGWTTLEFFIIGEKTYMLLLKRKGYGADGNNVHIHGMNADGTVGAVVPGGTYKWSEGWTQARPYTVGGTPYLFLLKDGDGSVHIHRLNGDGTVGARIKDYDWSSGWTDVEFYPVPSGTCMLLMKGA